MNSTRDIRESDEAARFGWFRSTPGMDRVSHESLRQSRDNRHDPIEQIRLAVKTLDAEDRRGWSGAARSDQLVELLEVIERLQAEALRAIGEWDARTDWALDGALSPRT